MVLSLTHSVFQNGKGRGAIAKQPVIVSRALVGLRAQLVGLPDQPTFTGGIGMKAAREAAGQRAAAKRAAAEEARPEAAADEATVVAAQARSLEQAVT